MGDVNAKVGAENKGVEHRLGKHDLGNQNRNGEFFVDLCAKEIYGLWELPSNG
jgi:hypothetical protein